MRNTLLRKALEKKTENVNRLTSEGFVETVEKAKNMWIEFEPRKLPCKLIGIDSSHNSLKYQGVLLYGIDVFASDENGEKIFEDADIRTTTQQDEPSSRAAEFEIIALKNSIGKADYVLVDGSVLSHNFRDKKNSDEIIDLLTNNPNIIFISKTSYSKKQFSGNFGDMMYFNKATKKTGMTKVLKTVGTRFASKNFTISYVFARLAMDTQLLRVEMFGDEHDEDEFRDVLDHISYKSKHGYPHVLKLAHNNCEITNKELQVIADQYSLKYEIGSREAVSH